MLYVTEYPVAERFLLKNTYALLMQESVKEDSVSLSTILHDAVPFMLDSLPEETKLLLGHQIADTSKLCTFDHQSCDLEQYAFHLLLVTWHLFWGFPF